MKKFIAPVLIAAMFIINGCDNFDVVRKDAVRSFGELIRVYPLEKADTYQWKLTAPDGGAWFFFDNINFEMAVDAEPFVNAGLDLSKLDSAGEHSLNPGRDSIYFSTPSFLGSMFNENVKDTALEQFDWNIRSGRDNLGFHAEGDHHAIEFGDGNAFEWASDLSFNTANGEPQDKNIVFALNPQPLIDAGADIENIEGWDYVILSMMGESIPKLVKAFDLSDEGEQ